MLLGQRLVQWSVSANNPNHGRARFEHSQGFFLDFDVNVPRGLSEAARQNAFSVELTKCAAKVRDFDVEAGQAEAQRWVDQLEEDRRTGYSAD